VISCATGLVLIGMGYYIQTKSSPSSAPFWLYIVGVPIYFCGETWLFLTYNVNTIYPLIYLGSNVGLLIGLIYTKNRIFLLFGGVGVLWYVGDLYRQYSNAWWLPLVITLLGLGFIALAVYYSGGGGGLKTHLQALGSLRRKLRKQKPSLKTTTDVAYSKVATDEESLEMTPVPVFAVAPELSGADGAQPVLMSYVPVVYDVNASGYVHVPMPYTPVAETV